MVVQRPPLVIYKAIIVVYQMVHHMVVHRQVVVVYKIVLVAYISIL